MRMLQRLLGQWRHLQELIFYFRQVEGIVMTDPTVEAAGPALIRLVVEAAAADWNHHIVYYNYYYYYFPPRKMKRWAKEASLPKKMIDFLIH
jgi:hypothetical protein